MKNGGNSWKPKQSSTDRSWVVLVRRSFKTREAFRCSCVYFATQYNVHYDNRQAGHLLSVLRLERCTAAIIFPHNKMAQKITEQRDNAPLNSISQARLNFRRRPFLCTTFRNLMQASNFGGTFDQLFLWIFLWNIHRRCLSTSSIPWCKKVKMTKNSNQGVLP